MGGARVDRERVLALLDEGRSSDEVARLANVHRATVYRIAKEEHCERTPVFARRDSAPDPLRDAQRDVAIVRAEADRLEAEHRLEETRQRVQEANEDRRARIRLREEQLRQEEEEKRAVAAQLLADKVLAIQRQAEEERERMWEPLRAFSRSFSAANEAAAARLLQQQRENARARLRTMERAQHAQAEAERRTMLEGPGGEWRRCASCSRRYLVEEWTCFCPACGGLLRTD